MLPHDGAGGCWPSPRNDRLDSAMIAAATVRLDWIKSGGSMLGRIARSPIRSGEPPSARAASTYSSALTARTVLRASRRKTGNAAIPIAIIAESSLSFLGLGQQPPAPSWGSMLNAAQRYLSQAPWMALYPGLAIFAIVLALNVLGDGLRDVLDPKHR